MYVVFEDLEILNGLEHGGRLSLDKINLNHLYIYNIKPCPRQL